LFESARLHEALTTSPLTFATADGKVIWTNGPCVHFANGQPQADGSLQASLDGSAPPTSGTLLPTGSHTYVVSFSDCLVDSLAGIELTGVASAAYRATDWSNLTATVSADSVRGQGLPTGQFSELRDVTAEGSALWTSVGSSSSATTYIPATGSRLVNNSTGNVATFGGGSYSVIPYPPPQGSYASVEYRFEALQVAINGTAYTLNGSLELIYGFRGSPTYTGEIRIINNGTLAARIYGDVRSVLTIEILVPLVPL
jgi:hypothetical protein